MNDQQPQAATGVTGGEPTIATMISSRDLTSAAIAQTAAQEASAEADRQFGAAIREAITDAHSAEVARAVMQAFTHATKPATPARKLQDRVHAVISARLDKIVGEVAP